MTQEFFDKNYRFGIDWINGVLPVQDVDEVFSVLESFSSKLRKSRWQLASTGKYNYKVRYMLDNKPFIQLMYNPDAEPDLDGNPYPMACIPETSNCNNPYVFFTISGDGIRYLSSIGGDMTALNKLLCYFYANGFRSSRFDVYCDILDKDNEVVPLLKKSFYYFLNPRVGCPTLSTNLHRDRKNIDIRYSVDDEGKRFFNLTLGHHGSTSGMFRCYNKLVELKDGRLSGMSDEILKEYGVSDYWYRLEYELHDTAESAFNAAMQDAAENGHLCVRKIFRAAAGRFFVPVKYDTVSKSNICNLPSFNIWDNFLEMVSQNPYFVYVSAVPYVLTDRKRMRENIERLKGYLYAIFLEYDKWSDFRKAEFMEEARLQFESKKKYNLLRDELDYNIA